MAGSTKLIGCLVFVTALATLQGQTLVSHFDFDTYPDLNSVLSSEPSQPKQTGQSNNLRFSILFPDLVCRVGRGKVLRVKLLVPSGSTGLDFQLQIWRRNPEEDFTLIDVLTKTFSSAGTYELEDGIDFSEMYMEFNDMLGIWLPWKYPVATISGASREANLIVRYTGPGSNTFDQNPPPVNSTLPISFPGVSSFYLAIEVELESLEGGKVVMHAIPEVMEENEYDKVFRVKRQVNGPTTLIYSPGVMGDKGEQGPKGAVGAPGAAGDQGVEGAQGLTGVKGSKGLAGAPGDNGVNVLGATGLIGATGLVGQQGVAGSTGSIGLQGQQGATGITGSTGSIGATGAKGPQGEKGTQGPQGVKGPTGPPGDDGAEGDKGDTGTQGPTGEKGEKGPPGDPLQTVLNAKATTCADITCENARCEETLIGAICVCIDGYAFVPGNNKKCEDINECLQGVCHHNCENTAGGYTCSCEDGYEIRPQVSNYTCVRVNGQCDCLENEESCQVIASGSQCLPTTISIKSPGDRGSQAKAQTAEVKLESSSWVNESWVIVFIVWGIVLTVLTLIIGVWLVYESRQSTFETPDYDTRSHMTGSLGPHGLILTPMPASNSMAGRYNGNAPSFAQLQYSQEPIRDDIYN